MTTWKIQPSYKKSLIERMHFVKGKKRVIVETGWRSGTFHCETEDDTPPDIEAGDDLYHCDYDVEMEETFDGCWEDHEFVGFTDKQKEKMETWLEENSIFDLEEDGWVITDTEMIIDCDPIIEKVTE